MEDDIDIPGLPKPRPRTSPGSGPGLGLVLLVSLLTSVLASVATVVVMGRLGASGAASSTPAVVDAGHASVPILTSGQDQRMPNLVPVPLDNARSIAESLSLELVVREQRANASVPAGSVMLQVPLAGTSVPRGQRVEVVVSSGPGDAAIVAAPTPGPPVAAPTPAPAAADAGTPGTGDLVEVPRLVGRRFPRVQPLIEAAGLVLGRRTTEFDEDRGPYAVLRQTPAAGSRVPRGTAINLVVNQGE